MHCSKMPITLCVLVLAFSLILPAYAEVTSVKTNKSLYTPDNKIEFTGTVNTNDFQKLVNIVIHDPTGKFVLVTGGFSDTKDTFDITVDATGQFNVKGTYNATAFIVRESDGKVASFDFSPDGSPVVHPKSGSTSTNVQNNTSTITQNNQQTSPPPQNNTQTSTQSQSIDQIIQQRIENAKKLQELLKSQQNNSHQNIAQHHVIPLNEGVGFVDSVGNLSESKVSNSPVSQPPAQYDLMSVLYLVIALCGVGIVVAILYKRKRVTRPTSLTKEHEPPFPPTIPSSESRDDYAVMILKNRLAKGEITIDEFKSIKDALNEP